MISKQPRDLLRLDPLREFYKSRAAQLRIVLMLRDPRDLLTCQSQRNNGDRVDYCGTIPAWRQYFAPFVLQREKLDTLVVRFEDLIADASAQQQRVERFIGEVHVAAVH